MTDVLDDTAFDAAYMPQPSIVAAEQAVLGAAIQSRQAAEIAGERVTAADFFRAAHQLIFEAVNALIEDGYDVDPTAVLGELTRRGTVQQAGAGPYLHTLIQHAAVGRALTEHARRVFNDAVRRRVSEVSPLTAQLTGHPDFDPDRDVDMIRRRLDAATARVTGDDLPTLGEIVLRRIDALENGTTPTFVEYPYLDVQACCGGLRPGQLIVVAARPSVGKSVVALDIARHAALRRRRPTLMFSLEMSEAEVADRALAAEARVPLNLIRDNLLGEQDWDRIARRYPGIVDAPLTIDDSGHCTLARIRARLRGMARTQPAELVIVDYLQLMESARPNESRQVQVSEFSRGLKLLAKEFTVPVVALSQVNRESTKGHDVKAPTISQLRDSGAIEQDADVVILLHREDAFDKESPRAGEMDLIVGKNRNGPTATITVAWQGHYARAVDMVADENWSPTRGLS